MTRSPSTDNDARVRAGARLWRHFGAAEVDGVHAIAALCASQSHSSDPDDWSPPACFVLEEVDRAVEIVTPWAREGRVLELAQSGRAFIDAVSRGGPARAVARLLCGPVGGDRIVQSDAPGVYEAAVQAFARERLSFPPLPAPFHARLRPFGDGVFTTRALDHGPYAMGVLVGEAFDGRCPADYAVVGFDGYGIESRAVHYIVVQPGLALFVQLAWGGVSLDADAARAGIVRAFAFAGALQCLAAQIAAAGAPPSSDRLVVSLSAFGDSGWGWARGGARPPVWHRGAGLPQAVTAQLEGLVPVEAASCGGS